METRLDQNSEVEFHESEIEKLKSQAKSLSIINSFARSILKQNSVDEIAWCITKQAIAQLNFEDCVVYIINKDGYLIQKAAHGSKNPRGLEIKNRLRVKTGSGIVGTVAETGIPEIISDTSLDARYIVDDEFRLSEICVPIQLNGKVLGVIDSENKEANFFNKEHLQLLETVAALSAIRIKNAQDHEDLQKHQIYLEDRILKSTEDLNKTIEDLKSVNENLQFFTHAASHDLKEPLRTISIFSSLVSEKSEKLSAREKRHLDYVSTSAKRMTDLINGLLDFGKMNEVDHHFERIDLNHLISNLISSVFSSFSEQKVNFSSDKLPTIEGNKELLNQLFQNLISNSIKFSKKNTIDLNIRFRPYKNHAFFIFSDNGIGFNPEYAKSLFKMFHRLQTKEEFEGSGIGLALCKRACTKHSGSIKAKSKGENNGARFLFSLKQS